MPQLLGAFGAVGAVAGAATAILIPLGAALLKASDVSAQFDDKLKLVTEATDLMTAAVEAAATPISVLTARYGEAAGAAQAFYQQQSAISQAVAAAALADLGESIGGVGGQLGDNSRKAGWLPSLIGGISGVEVKTLSDTNRKVQELMDKYRLGRSHAERLAVAMQKAMDADADATLAVAAAEELNSAMIEIAGGADKVGAKFGGEDGLWGKVDAYFRQATAQVQAMRTEQDRVVSQYQADTEKMAKLANDRKVAEGLLKEAIIAGAMAVNAKAVEAAHLIIWDRLIRRCVVLETGGSALKADLRQMLCRGGMLRSYPQHFPIGIRGILHASLGDLHFGDRHEILDRHAVPHGLEDCSGLALSASRGAFIRQIDPPDLRTSAALGNAGPDCRAITGQGCPKYCKGIGGACQTLCSRMRHEWGGNRIEVRKIRHHFDMG